MPSVAGRPSPVSTDYKFHPLYLPAQKYTEVSKKFYARSRLMPDSFIGEGQGIHENFPPPSHALPLRSHALPEVHAKGEDRNPSPVNDSVYNPSISVIEGSRVARAYAQSRLSSTQYGCLNKLWIKESGWRWNAGNPTSGAYGIPQALPGSKMASSGSDWRTNPITQVKWGLGYIGGRYGTPCAAWAHFLDRGWY